MSTKTPKVTIVMPSFNVAPYIRECMDSVVNQTLREIEIFVVDAFSTDGTREILEEYARNDTRVYILDDDKGSTGYANNIAIDAASGEYIGIVETDDYISPYMFERLYETAASNNCDIVKGNYKSFTGDGEERRFCHHNLLVDPQQYGKVLEPLKEEHIFENVMFNWAGIYKREFLNRYHIRHNETNGAAFQDNGFFIQAFALAGRVCYLKEDFYFYRWDNPNSSIHNPNRIYSMCDEYDFAENRLRQYPDVLKTVWFRYLRRRYGACSWTLKKVAPEFRLMLLKRMKEDFQKRVHGESDICSIQPKKEYQDEMKMLLNDSDAYLEYMEKKFASYSENLERLYIRIRKYRSFVLFGAGENGNRLQIELEQNGLLPEIFIDNNKSLEEKQINHISIVSPEEGVKMHRNALYIITMKDHYAAAREQLVKLGINREDIIRINRWKYFWD